MLEICLASRRLVLAQRPRRRLLVVMITITIIAAASRIGVRLTSYTVGP